MIKSRPTRNASEPAALSAASPVPLYRQLAEQILSRIDSGALAPGQQLETEPELMAQHGVSRVTVRQAIALLQKRGKLMARRGKGTFVTNRVVQHDLNSLQGFYDALRAKGVEPETKLLEFSPDAGSLDDSLPASLALPVRLKRLYSIDGRPFALVVGYLPSGAKRLGQQRAERLTVYEILEHYLGAKVARAEVTIRCQRAPRDVCRILGLKPQDQALVMERQSFSSAEVPCEFMRIFILPEHFEFSLRVTGAIEIARSVHPVARAPAK